MTAGNITANAMPRGKGQEAQDEFWQGRTSLKH